MGHKKVLFVYCSDDKKAKAEKWILDFYDFCCRGGWGLGT